MLRNCLFGTYRAPATKMAFLSTISPNPATIRIVCRSEDSKKLRLKSLPVSHDGHGMIDKVCPESSRSGTFLKHCSRAHGGRHLRNDFKRRLVQ
jgi:hypothetical protein